MCEHNALHAILSLRTPWHCIKMPGAQRRGGCDIWCKAVAGIKQKNEKNKTPTPLRLESRETSGLQNSSAGLGFNPTNLFGGVKEVWEVLRANGLQSDWTNSMLNGQGEK